jgi:hypothetical protein
VSDAIAIAAAHDLACAIRRDRSVVCWGAMSANDDAKARALVRVSGVTDAEQIAIGDVPYVLRRDGVVLRVDANRAASVVEAR